MSLGQYIKSLRQFRRWHRLLGIGLLLFILVSATTGILLSWKKDIGLLQPPTQKGISTALEDWKSLDTLQLVAQTALHAQLGENTNTTISRMDVRPSKGMVKVLFEEGWWEVQLDGTTATVLSVERRHADWIEALHDGSIIGDLFKLLSMNLLGIGLLVMSLTGFGLWYGPKQIRKLKRKQS